MTPSLEKWLRAIDAERHLRAALKEANELNGTTRMIEPVGPKELFRLIVDDEGAEELCQHIMERMRDTPA